MENKSNAFSDFIKPILVLVIICFVVTFALAFTYGITAPVIEKNTKAAADATRTELLPQAEGKFTEYTGKLVELEPAKVFVSETYTADNGSGVVVTVKSNSYGGLLTAMVGIDKDGAVTSVKVTDAADTAGVGTKAQEDGHLSQYKGLSKLSSTEVKKDADVKPVTGASVSSGAVHKAVYCALEQFKKMGGVK